jgi:demethylmenaquinone methyltransferase/2-methoxy-6-polyprenyl-1,4-benzoquinol methylase
MKQIYDKQEPESIQEMFGTIAPKYDRANAVLSLRMHKHWNTELLQRVIKEQQPDTLLDLCCGTGDIGLSFLLNSTTPRQAIMLDFCSEMLDCAKQKAAKLNLTHHALTYVQADAQAIPLADSTIPCATIAYGIRNIKDPAQCMQEVHRVLVPGGTFGILELTRPKHPVVRLGHNIYLKSILPMIGRWLTSNKQAYEYLSHSINHFIPPEKLEGLMKGAGFKSIIQKPLAFGIATILIGQKAKDS